VAGLAAIVIVAGYLFAADTAILTTEAGADFVQALVVAGMVAGGLLLASGLIFLWSLVDLALKVEAHSFRMYDVLREIETSLEAQREPLRILADNSQLSDAARAIAHHAKDRLALRQAVNEEVVRGDWPAAYALVELLEARPEYQSESALLRKEVDIARARVQEGQVHAAVQQVGALLNRHDWDRARREMDRLLAENPDNPEVAELPELLTRHRGEYKRRLLKQWDEAVQRNEVDRGIAILKDLDHYLTPNEAAALEESARGVFRAKLHNLGVRFSLAVTDSDWREALEAGQQIMDEFPNSRMAQEARQWMQVLTERAEAAAMEAGPSSTVQD
jgi:tetratricopeptide (TPR) repeat protein